MSEHRSQNTTIPHITVARGIITIETAVSMIADIYLYGIYADKRSKSTHDRRASSVSNKGQAHHSLEALRYAARWAAIIDTRRRRFAGATKYYGDSVPPELLAIAILSQRASCLITSSFACRFLACAITLQAAEAVLSSVNAACSSAGIACRHRQRYAHKTKS